MYLLLAPIVLTSSFEKFKPLWNPSLVTLDEASITNTRSRPLLSFKLIILPLVSMPSVGFDLLHPLWLSWLQVYSINVSITFLRRKIAVELISLKRFSNSSEKNIYKSEVFHCSLSFTSWLLEHLNQIELQFYSGNMGTFKRAIRLLPCPRVVGNPYEVASTVRPMVPFFCL